MPLITQAEAFMVDLVPKVKRTDAIQSFKSQETIFVRLTDAEGAEGMGYAYTIGDGGPSIMALLRQAGWIVTSNESSASGDGRD